MPRPIYTDPEIAGVGLTEAQAREQYGDDVAVGEFPWVANARAVMQGETTGWVKSIHETKYGELLGLVMVGPHVTDLIEAGTVAIDAEATVETVADGMAAHPTLSEAIKEAGLVALGRAIHLPNTKRARAGVATPRFSDGDPRCDGRSHHRSLGDGDGPGVTAAATTAVLATGAPMTPTRPTRAALRGIFSLLRLLRLRRPRWRR